MRFMRTVGQILKEAREAKLYSLEDVEKHIKIRRELLEALEQNDYSKLPPPTFIQGFIKNYGKFLGLDANKLLAVFRRDFESKKHPPVVMESFSNPLGKSSRFRLTPSRVIAGIVVLIILLFFGYLWFEYRQFVGAPDLVVTSPQDQQTVEIPTVVVNGKTDSEAKVAINSQDVGTDKDGSFHEELKLSSSTNKIIITSTGKFGQTAKVERTVFVKN